MFRRFFSVLFYGLISWSLVGCDGGAALDVADTSSAEFSTEDDYADYDRESAEFASGQE